MMMEEQKRKNDLKEKSLELKEKESNRKNTKRKVN